MASLLTTENYNESENVSERAWDGRLAAGAKIKEMQHDGGR